MNSTYIYLKIKFAQIFYEGCEPQFNLWHLISQLEVTDIKRASNLELADKIYQYATDKDSSGHINVDHMKRGINALIYLKQQNPENDYIQLCIQRIAEGDLIIISRISH